MRRLFTFLLLASSAQAASLEIRYGALERLIGQQMFTTEGRRYVRGSQVTKCNFAYLESPKLHHGGASRIELRVHFTGRSAVDMLGRCVGMGDSFDLVITGQPVARDGAIAFDQLAVSTPRDSYYIRRVRSALLQTMNKDFRIDVRDHARAILETPRGTGAYEQELHDLRITSVQSTQDALILEVDFRLTVK